MRMMIIINSMRHTTTVYFTFKHIQVVASITKSQLRIHMEKPFFQPTNQI